VLQHDFFATLCYSCVIEVVRAIRSMTTCCYITAAPVTLVSKKGGDFSWSKEKRNNAVQFEFCYLRKRVLVIIYGVLKRRNYHNGRFDTWFSSFLAVFGHP